MQRSIHEALIKWKEKRDRQPLLLQGARQVGKTYALKAFGKAAYGRTFYLNFEDEPNLAAYFEMDLKPERILQAISFKFGTSIDPEGDLVIFDEIQAAPKALTSLKYFAENMPRLSVCAAGSLLGVHLGEGSFPVGKVEFLDMHPMTFAEFLGGIGEGRSEKYLAEFDFSEPIPGPIHDHLWEMFKHYLIVGGLPKPVLAYAERKEDLTRAFAEVRIRQRELYIAYLADMAKHAGKANSMHIERVFHAVPAQMARTLDSSAPKFTFKDVVKGIHGYVRLAGPIDWLKAAGLVHKVPIVNKAWAPLQAFADESVFKLYSFDVGLLGSMGGLAPEAIIGYDFGSYKGYLAENFALQELAALNKGIPVSWKENTSELEFLLDLDGKIVPLEIKSGWVTQAKSLKVFAGKYAPEKRATLSARNFSRDRGSGSFLVPIYLAGRLREMLAAD